MTRAIYVNPDLSVGPPKAASLSCGWFPVLPYEYAGLSVPCAVVDGPNGRQVFPEPITPSQVAAAIAADVALDATAAAAQAVIAANADTLRGRAQAALAANVTFLAIGSPTTAQVTAQAKALTRQVDALIRLAINLTDSVADS